MTPGMTTILQRAHDNGGTVRLTRVGDTGDFIKCCKEGYLLCQVADDRTYQHHLLTNLGREALIRAR